MFLLMLMLMLCLPVSFSKLHRFQQRTKQCLYQCVSPDLCGDENADGIGLLNPRISEGKCPKQKDICCEHPLPVKASASASTKDASIPRCGTSTATRILSTSTASFGELPWNLIVLETSQNLYRCGATLIHPKVAITAAHCASPYSEEPERILVRAGEWKIDSKEKPLPVQESFVEEIVVHHEYHPLSLKNDVAILIMAEAFELAANVGVVCLPAPGDRVVEGRCVASGWGKSAHSNGEYSTVLKKVELPLVKRSYCLERLRATRLGPRYNLHNSFICAGGRKGQDSCKGDGGSPLVCPSAKDEERFVQMGIVSWGIGCGEEGIPGVYVNVPLAYEWIRGEMLERELDTSYFKL